MVDNLISVDDFFNSGLPVSDDIRTEEVEFAINSVEKNYIKPIVGSELFAELVTDPDSYSYLLDTTPLTNGIRHAECEMVFAIMLFDRFRATRYTTVVKDSEESSEPSENEIMSVCSMHWEQALQTITDTLLENGLEPTTEIIPSPVFFELTFPVYRKKEARC